MHQVHWTRTESRYVSDKDPPPAILLIRGHLLLVILIPSSTFRLADLVEGLSLRLCLLSR